MCEWQGPDDGDAPSAFSEKWRRARVSHECFECGGKIAVGERYRFVSGVWEGRGDSFKFCLQCTETLAAFAKEHDGERPYYGGLDEALGECVDEETTINDDDTETLSEAGQRWQKALDEMRARRAARGAA